MSHYFNLIVNLVEYRLVELAVNGSRRIQSFPELSGNSESTWPPHDGTNLSSCSARKLSASVHRTICGFGDSWPCFCSLQEKTWIRVYSLNVNKADTGKHP